MKKTPVTYFNRFKQSFLEWQQKLGLTQYNIYFTIKALPDAYAEILIQQPEMIANVNLSDEYPSDETPESLGKHEAIHLLIHRLKWLGESRYIATSDLMEECEAVVVRLEHVLE